KEPFDFPAPPEAPKDAAILRRGAAAADFMGRDPVDAIALAEELVERIAVVGAIADQARGERGREALGERGFDKGDFIWRSAGQVEDDRKTMAVADRHDFAALTASSRPDGRAPFFAELKLPSTNASLRSSLPRSRKSSARFWSNCNSTPERCQC